MSLLGVQVSILAGPLVAGFIAVGSAKDRKPESLNLGEIATLIFVVALAWFIFSGFWHVALGGNPAAFMLANLRRAKSQLYVYASYCAFATSISLWCLYAWQCLKHRGQKA